MSASLATRSGLSLVRGHGVPGWALDAALYRPGAPTPDLARLREAWRGLSRANGASSIRTEDPLPALYAPH